MGQFRATTTAAVIMALCATALAVKPAKWTHEQPKDFSAGKLENVVVSTLGEVTLGRQTKTLLESEEDVEVINALARGGDGKIYAATGPKGRIYQVDGETVRKFASLPEDQTALSLLFTQDGRLLVGSGGGEQARIYVIDEKGNAEVFYEPKDVTYVWAMARGPAGEIYAATGIEGQLFRIEPDGKSGKVLADLKPRNLLCLAFGPDWLLYAGTDGDGLIYRINTETGKTFVMYDAKEAEISSIVIDEDGVIYASTAAADRARPGKPVADKPGGKPETSGPATQPKSPGTRPAGDETEDEDDESDDKPVASAPAGAKPQPRAVSLAESFSRMMAAAGGSSAGAAVGSGGEGNAIYRIDTNGFVTEVFRMPVIIFALAEADGTLYVATGNEGRIYAVTPAKDEIIPLVKLEPTQATTILRQPSGELLIGTANTAKLVRISPRYAEKGTLTSKPLDAGQIVKWGRMVWNADVPTGTRLTISTRSSNIEDEESESWEEWSDPIDATAPQQVQSVGARFLQYKLTFETTLPDATPTLRRLEIARIEENRPPRIPSLEVLSAREEAERPGSSPKVKALVGGGYGGENAPRNPDYYWVIKWKAEDANNDGLQYEVFYRELGAGRWIRMEEDLRETFRIWDTRTVPDGRYEVKVVASDAPDNPQGMALSVSRISDPLIVDNTPPEARISRSEVSGRSVTLHVTFNDALTSITGAEFSVDSDEKWFDLAADDDIFDSPAEAATFTVKELETGEHRIAVRVHDEHGNTRYVTQSVTIGG